MPRRYRRQLVGGPSGARFPSHRTFALRVLRFHAARRRHAGGPGGRLRPLLDHLGIERAVVIGFSAGSGSILELARRHPERVTGLILACCRLGGGITTPRAFAPVFRLAYSVDRLFWNFKKPIGEGRPQSHRRLLRQAPEVLKAEGVLTLVVRQPAQRLLSPDHRARWSPSERARRLLCRMCSGERVEVAAGGWFLSLRARAPRWPERR